MKAISGLLSPPLVVVVVVVVSPRTLWWAGMRTSSSRRIMMVPLVVLTPQSLKGVMRSKPTTPPYLQVLLLRPARPKWDGMRAYSKRGQPRLLLLPLLT